MRWNAEVGEVVEDVLARQGRGPETPVSWTMIEDLGWPGVAIPESAGGSGGDLADLAEIVRGAYRHNAGVPLVETAVARWLDHLAGRPLPAVAPSAVAVADGRSVVWLPAGDGGGTLAGRLMVPWLKETDSVTVALPTGDATTAVVRLPTTETPVAGVLTEARSTIGPEPRGELRLDSIRRDASQVQLLALPIAAVLARLALLRAAAVLGAADRAISLTAEHVQARTQFGRPLGELQAVQQAMGQILAERTLLEASVARALADENPGLCFAARILAASTATHVARTAHQLHGAIGITREHSLHASTTRLLEWRDDARFEQWWARELGLRVAGPSDDALWDLTEQPDGGSPL